MTIKLLDLYNEVATQEWSMYDNDALSGEEMEASLVLALNKSITEILYSYEFPFRLKSHLLIVLPGKKCYNLPKGIIKKDNCGNYSVKFNSELIKYIPHCDSDCTRGIPNSFSVEGEKLILSPIPIEKGLLRVDYYTLAIGENSEGEKIYALKNEDDVLYCPAHLETLLKNAVIARTMLNSISEETDENYSAYKKQSETAYRLLIKYSKGVMVDKEIRF